MMNDTPLPTPDDTTAPGTSEETEVDPEKKKLWKDFISRIDACKAYRRKLLPNWTVNIDYRRGKPFASSTDEDRVVVNLDWSLTKQKQAVLFSQVPKVHVDHPPETVAAGDWLFSFEQRLNDTLVVAGVEPAIDECLPDCINAAGIGGVLVAHESITEDKLLPAFDLNSLPPQFKQIVDQTGKMPNGTDIPMEVVPQVVDHRYTISRVSPADLLWPINFTGSDFDQAPWIGRSGRISWTQAVQRFKLTDEDKEKMLGDSRTSLDRLSHDVDREKNTSDDEVGFDEIFYKEFTYHKNPKSFSLIHHLVFVNGKQEPVIDESWKGQQFNPETRQLLGSTRYPIRILTLTYITDETIPPSDSAIGRPQVNEINKSRTQMILQRERSLPVRWFNVNGIDPLIQQSLMRGTWQAMIPVQGDGSRHIGEVARASIPQENFVFNKIAKDDIAEAWQIGQFESGQGVETKGEANVIQQNFQTRIGRERAKIAKFFVSIAEVVGGLLCLYEPPESFGEGFDPGISKALTYSILADSTVLLDSNQRLQRLIQFINFSAKSGWVDIGSVLKEVATLSGLDPNVVIRPPEPKPPVEPNISLRLTGTEDMMNPLTLAFLMKSGQAPSTDMVEAAKQLIQSAVTAPAGSPRPDASGPPGGLPPGPQAPGEPGVVSGAAPPIPPDVVPHPGHPISSVTPPDPSPPGDYESHKDFNVLPRVNKRRSST